MRTIEEASGDSYYVLVLEHGCNTGSTFGKAMFEKGVEFAQRWTPIEANNLPESDGKYLVLRSNGDWTSTYFQKSTNSFANYYSDLHYFTHWRQIEIK